MSGLALIGQGLRGDECAAFLRSQPDDWALVTGNDRWIADNGLPAGTRVIVLESDLSGMPERIRAGLRNRVLAWTRRGSRVGRTSERAVRWVKHRVTPAGATRLPIGAGKGESNVDRLETHTRTLLEVLESEHASRPLAELAVFDLFDLPAALDFARSNDIRVKVR